MNMKTIVKDGQTYIEVNDFEEWVKKSQKHCNGYAYDSLIYRYQFIRMKLAQYEADEYLMMNGGTRSAAHARVNDLAERDIKRFGEILDEVIKEHD